MEPAKIQMRRWSRPALGPKFLEKSCRLRPGGGPTPYWATPSSGAVGEAVGWRLQRSFLGAGNEDAFAGPDPIAQWRLASGRRTMGTQKGRAVGDEEKLGLMTGKLSAAAEAVADVVNRIPGARVIQPTEGGELGRGSQGQMDWRINLLHRSNGRFGPRLRIWGDRRTAASGKI